MRKPTRFASLPGVMFAVSAAVGVATHISPARAQTPSAAAASPSAETKATARAAYGAGEKAYGAGDYAMAETKFEEANRLIPSIHARYWIAMCRGVLGKPGSYEALEAVLADPESSKLGAEKIDAGKARLTELAKVPASVEVTSNPPGGALTIDGNESGTTPNTVELPAGSHKLTVTLEGYEPMTVDLTVKPGEKASKELELTESAPPPAPTPGPAPEAEPTEAAAPPQKEERSLIPAYVTLGVAGASAIVGTIFGLQALSASSDFDDSPTTEKADDAERNALIADMAFGVTITLGITGIVLLTAGDDSELSARNTPTTSPRLHVTPYAGPKGGGAAARVTF
jgi:hypothetical protein